MRSLWVTGATTTCFIWQQVLGTIPLGAPQSLLFPSRAGNPGEADETPPVQSEVFPVWHMSVKQKRAAKSQYS